MEYKKISVLIVTYKQANVIGRNIESILQQKDYGLHEIVICDDCSPDNNWEVIQSYVRNIQISLEHIGIIQILAFTVIQINVLYFMEMQSCSVGWREMMH